MFERIQYLPPWKTTNWGFGFWPVNRGGDEWGNPSVYFILPLLGMLVIFYGRNLNRDTWFLSGTNGSIAHYISPNYEYEAHVHYDRDEDIFETQPVLDYNQIRTKAHLIKKIDY